MRLRRAPDPVSDRVWARLTPRDGGMAPEPEPRGPEPRGPEPPEPPWVPERPEVGAASRRGGRAEGRREGSSDEVRRFRVEVPGRLRGAEWVVSHRAALGMALVLVVALAVFGLRLAWAGAADAPRLIRPQASTGASRAGASPGPSTTPDAGPGGVSSTVGTTPGPLQGAAGVGVDGVVVVDVTGQVVRPGLVRLPAGSRVADALAAVGGATPEADLGALNQARLLLDGEQIRVPRPGEVVAGVGSVGAGGGGVTSGVTGGVGGPGGGAAGALVSLNRADVAAFDTLPGVGPVLAQRIVDWRTAHGRFTAVDELGEVTGIGDKLLAQLRPLVTL